MSQVLRLLHEAKVRIHLDKDYLDIMVIIIILFYTTTTSKRMKAIYKCVQQTIINARHIKWAPLREIVNTSMS